MPLTELFEPRGPEFLRQIERDYHLRTTAENTDQLKAFQAEALRVQIGIAAQNVRLAEFVDDNLRWTGSSLSGMQEYMGTLLDGMDRANDALNSLNETTGHILDAVVDLSDLLGDALSRISQQIMDQQQTLDEIAALLKRPYQTRVRELRIEAQKWLFRGMQRKERDRHEDWKDAMRLLKTVTDNPVGMQDYVVWFQTGWLLWKQQKDVIAAEEAFYRSG